MERIAYVNQASWISWPVADLTTFCFQSTWMDHLIGSSPKTLPGPTACPRVSFDQWNEKTLTGSKLAKLLQSFLAWQQHQFPSGFTAAPSDTKVSTRDERASKRSLKSQFHSRDTETNSCVGNQRQQQSTKRSSLRWNTEKKTLFQLKYLFKKPSSSLPATNLHVKNC